MRYLIHLTFDLIDAKSTDYHTAYEDLEKLGLSRLKRRTTAPLNKNPSSSVMGVFDGPNAGQTCESVQSDVVAAFKARGFKSELFFVAGDKWAFVASST